MFALYVLLIFAFSDYILTVGQKLEYIGMNREVVTGISYFVMDDGVAIQPDVVPSPDLSSLKKDILVASTKGGDYILYEAATQKYDNTYSLYLIGSVQYTMAGDIISALTPVWKTYTSDPSTILQAVDTEKAYGKYG